MSSRERPPAAQRGFTLVELMIAITILTIAVMATFVTQLGANNLMRQSRQTNTAMADLEAAMEEILILPCDQIPLAGGGYPPAVAIGAFTNLHLSGETIVPTYPGYAGVTVPDPLQVVLTCTFNDPKGRQRIIRLASMKTR